MGASWHQDQMTVLCEYGMWQLAKSSVRLIAIQTRSGAWHFHQIKASLHQANQEQPDAVLYLIHPTQWINQTFG